ncbi:TonB-dependent siderophore receptor [Vibrio europaeus]|uniref:TonB-dependent siderophore receptor n=1 Tax=Vibrio europaeus TaxID=300876 RepID=UPI00233EA1DE|nr:TonB-dependent siderophore receptor [Vibrio europaeus]MDC5818215.1 TonB-dependent siderophore receptor [Vibrio europaeus]MDC5839586.1 TonB-dependent siderophore receptor [Vibrio europaeus]MDC5857343.1 TonB-dependent siderophore receptor [Vibrio europaeus]MDC5871785.1 TonB-dependent siderophore receptor [Vibrio europaeus]
MKRVTNRPQNLSLLTLAVWSALSSGAVAQEVTHLEDVVVWGTKVSSSSESLGAGDMSLKQADHMSDLLRDVPGVDVGGTHSVNQRINIRGLGETDLDIRLDGASQHANMFHHIGNLTLNPDILKTAEIQVGNNSVTQNGLGGSVYFETKDAKDLLRGEEKFGTRVYGGYASNASQQGSATFYGLLGEKFDSMLYGNWVSRDNFKDGNGNETFGVKGDTYNVLGKLGYEPSELHRFELAYDLYRDSGDYSPRPDWSGSANNERSGTETIPTDYDRDTVTLSYELKGDVHKGKVTLYSSQTEIVRDESAVTSRWPGDRLSVNSAENKNVGANAKFQSDYQIGRLDNTVTYGLDYIDKTSKSIYGGVVFADESAINSAFFAENQMYITDFWSVTAGVRYDDYKRKAATGTSNFDDVTWSLATEWDVTNDWTLFASTRSLFKGPELLETFIKYQPTTHLASDIKAETGQNTQGGVRFNKQVNSHFFGASLTAFKTQIDDYIAEAYQSSTKGYLIYNKGDVEFTGFELSATYGYEAFNSKLSYSRSDNKDVTNGGPVLDANDRSMDIGDSIALTLDYQADSIDVLFGWTSIVVLEENNVLEGKAVKEGYNVHNLYAQWIPSNVEDLSVTFGIDNIFDEAYVSHASKTGDARGIIADDYEPGRNFKLSAAYQF